MLLCKTDQFGGEDSDRLMNSENQIKMMKKDFRLLERNVLLLIAIPLPIFSFAYLYVNSGNLEFNLPQLPEVFNFILLGLVSAMLLIPIGLES